MTGEKALASSARLLGVIVDGRHGKAPFPYKVGLLGPAICGQMLSMPTRSAVVYLGRDGLALFTGLPRALILGNSEGIKRAGADIPRPSAAVLDAK